MMIKIQALSRHVQLHLLLIFTSLLLIVVPAINKRPSAQIAEQSRFVAAQFLFLVDTEEYSKSWEISSHILQKMLTQDAWNEQITKIRNFLGPIVERMYHDISYTDTASDVPEGEYVILTYISKFKLRERVIETITLMLNDNNQWQVVGYFLR
jgi:hypothetical protein